MRISWALAAAVALAAAPLAAFSAAGPAGLISEAASYPNPFDARTGATKLRWTLGADAAVELSVFTVYGARVWTRSFPAGAAGARAGVNEAAWDGTDAAGRKVSKGLYLAVVRAGGERAVVKVGVRH